MLSIDYIKASHDSNINLFFYHFISNTCLHRRKVLYAITPSTRGDMLSTR